MLYNMGLHGDGSKSPLTIAMAFGPLQDLKYSYGTGLAVPGLG
jgi:hypothetical protein